MVSTYGSNANDVDEYDPEDVFAYGHNLCCKAYTKRRQCMNSENYNCQWLNKKSPKYTIDRKIIKRYGSQCLGTKFVKCKRTDINADCFNGEAATPEPCVYDDPFTMNDALCVYQDDDEYYEDKPESMLSRFITSEYDGNYSHFNLKLIGGVSGIILVSGLALVCYKRCKQDDGKGKYSSIDDETV